MFTLLDLLLSCILHCSLLHVPLLCTETKDSAFVLNMSTTACADNNNNNNFPLRVTLLNCLTGMILMVY